MTPEEVSAEIDRIALSTMPPSSFQFGPSDIQVIDTQGSIWAYGGWIHPCSVPLRAGDTINITWTSAGTGASAGGGGGAVYTSVSSMSHTFTAGGTLPDPEGWLPRARWDRQ